MTTRSMKEDDMVFIAELINKVITNIDNETVYNQVKAEIKEFAGKFPLHQKMK